MTGAGPASENPRWPEAVDRHVATVRTGRHTVVPGAFHAVVAELRGALLPDVREAGEIARARIPATPHVFRGLIEFRLWTLLGHPAPVARRA